VITPSVGVLNRVRVDSVTAGAQISVGGFVGSLETSYLELGYSAGASGSFHLSGGGSLVALEERVGYGGTGDFTQIAGTNTVTSLLSLGYLAGASGSYDLSGGSLSAVDEWIGHDGTGTFTQSGERTLPRASPASSRSDMAWARAGATS